MMIMKVLYMWKWHHIALYDDDFISTVLITLNIIIACLLIFSRILLKESLTNPHIQHGVFGFILMSKSTSVFFWSSTFVVIVSLCILTICLILIAIKKCQNYFKPIPIQPEIVSNNYNNHMNENMINYIGIFILAFAFIFLIFVFDIQSRNGHLGNYGLIIYYFTYCFVFTIIIPLIYIYKRPKCLKSLLE